jgi:Lipase
MYQIKHVIEIFTGLDPAGPLFTQPNVVNTSLRLDVTDAKSVQVIYTTRYVLGVSIEIGHENFIPMMEYTSNLDVCYL